jgi:hypothetical protein
MPHLTLCPEEWGLSTNVVNLDKANWFILGLGEQYIASLLHHMILLQCMAGWSIALAKATYEFVLRRPKKPPKAVSVSAQKPSKQNPEMWRHYHPTACFIASPTAVRLQELSTLR